MGSPNQLVDIALGACLVAVALALGSVLAGLVRRLRESDERYRALVEHLPRATVVVFDRGLRVERAGGMGLAAIGLNANDLKGRSLYEILPREEAEYLASHYRAALNGEARVLDHHSSISGQDYRLHLLPLADARGRVSRGLALTLDVTERTVVERELGQHAMDVGALSEAMRALAGSASPSAGRTAICEGARTVAGAPVAALLELSRHSSGLEAVASVGAKLSGLVWPLTGEPSRAAQAFTGAEPIFVADAVGEGDVDREFYRRTGASSALWHPVLHEGTAIGVMVVAWRRRVADASPRLAPLMDVLAAEAAVAIGRAELLERLGRMARTDDLTGLPNRRAWEEELPREIARAWRGDTTVCVAMLDLDRFKEYNDARGHQAGDRLLKKVTAAWHSELRPYDLLARYGGEEFGLILPGCELSEAVQAVERLRAATPEEMSCSAGIAEWAREEDPESLVGRADRALYEAKRSGRDRTIAARAAA
jgi:diguanylate cyclase (GGDEF)-like protein/PAS domain S-box-containing protein